jgi:hypothetical protein
VSDQFPTQVFTEQGWQPRTSSGLAVAFRITDADYTVQATTQITETVLLGLTAPRTVKLPANPVSGEIVIVKDGDGSLAAQNIIIDGNGHTIDGAATFTMTNIIFQPYGSVMVMFDGVTWGIVADHL